MSLKFKIVALLTVIITALYLTSDDKVPPPTRSRSINYSVTVTNKGNTAKSDVKIKVFRPLQKTPWQVTTSVDASAAYEPVSANGAEYLEFSFLLPPYGSKVINLSAKIDLWARPIEANLPPPSDLAPLFSAQGSPELSKLAASLNGSTPLSTAQRIQSWVKEHLVTTSYSAELLPLNVVFNTRRGDCTDLANLFVALARANGIPARTAAGFTADRDKRLRAVDYHNWGEFFAEGTWRIADPSAGVFDSDYERYITFGYLTPSSKPHELINPERFSANSNELELRLH